MSRHTRRDDARHRVQRARVRVATRFTFRSRSFGASRDGGARCGQRVTEAISETLELMETDEEFQTARRR